MRGYKTAIGECNEIIENAYSWVNEKGKQVYKFPEDAKEINLRCQLCEKKCYPAERVTYNSVPYHVDCFRCIVCYKKSTPGQLRPINNFAFVCSNHENKVLQKGKMIHQEKMEEEAYKRSRRRLKRKEAVESSAEEKPVDLTPGINWRAEGKKQAYRYPEDLSGPSKKIDPRCHKCGKTVYSAEKFTYEGIPYHNACARCFECGKKLVNADATPFGDEAFLCNSHYKKVFDRIADRSRSRSRSSPGTPSFEKTDDMGAGIAWKKSGQKQSYRFPEDLTNKPNPRCNLCGKTSYSAETITYNQIPYHKMCFRCVSCGVMLSAANANPFGPTSYLCNNHFKKVVQEAGLEMPRLARREKDARPGQDKDEFGFDPRMYKGYEWRLKTGNQTYKFPEDKTSKSISPRCNYCEKKSYPAETITYNNVPYHSQCFRCLKCEKKLSSANATPFGEEVFLCDSHFAQYGQGGGLPKKGEKFKKKVEIDMNADEYKNLSAIERRRLRKKMQQGG